MIRDGSSGVQVLRYKNSKSCVQSLSSCSQVNFQKFYQSAISMLSCRLAARVTGSYVVKMRYIDYQPAHSAGVDNPSMVLQRTSRLNKVFKSPFLRENVSPNAQLGGPCFEVNVQNIHKMSTCEDAVFPLNNVRNGSLS